MTVTVSYGNGSKSDGIWEKRFGFMSLDQVVTTVIFSYIKKVSSTDYYSGNSGDTIWMAYSIGTPPIGKKYLIHGRTWPLGLTIAHLATAPYYIQERKWG
jgi:hypothetical protein